MPFAFTDPARYPYRHGGFFLGADDQGREAGISTERHLMTVAGARSGKGAALIIPNLKRWRGSVVQIDPKGDNATATALDRAAMGQAVGVLDPYRIVKGDAAKLRASINPLAALDPASLNFRRDLEALSDGLIMRHDPKHEAWVRAARVMVGGVTDFWMATERRELWTLPYVRRCFLQDAEALRVMAETMLAADTPARLAPEAGALLLDKLNDADSIAAQTFASNLLPALGWIGDPAFDDVWQGLPEFDLSSLKAGNGTLYLVLPPNAIGPRGTFLRLFVSMALNVMMSDLHDHGDDARCLFLLDEFYSLGSLDLVAQAMGLMGGYGVSLWPFLQDLGQLRALYGDDLSGTFFGNSDAQIFFGNTDRATLDHVSASIGALTQEDIGARPPVQRLAAVDAATRDRAYTPVLAPRPTPTIPHRKFGGMLSIGGAVVDAARNAGYGEDVAEQSRLRQEIEQQEKQAAAADANAMRTYQHEMARKGEPRLTPDQVRELVAKHDGDKVARSMIVFAKGADVLNLRLAPYFQPTPAPLPAAVAPAAATVPDYVLTDMRRMAHAQEMVMRGKRAAKRGKVVENILSIAAGLFVFVLAGGSGNNDDLIGAALFGFGTWALASYFLEWMLVKAPLNENVKYGRIFDAARDSVNGWIDDHPKVMMPPEAVALANVIRENDRKLLDMG